ncbi:uncharacterized protein LOC117647876 [Thrips palmi]|uniref:Uncharacterized protein LOC117647876 n=1 Tax=Thrips palmi TaxID=161013 RepID=A0A6P8YZY3_THRPL|nr:uncharacterized protein LOC117647876 [Thrips palmi]
MPQAVHATLLHGAAYMRTFPVPIGILSEEALESCHKDIRYLGEHHSRKTGRDATMSDLFYGLLVRTDPIIAALRKAPSPKGVLKSSVMPMLLGANQDGSFAVDQSLQDIMEPESEDSDVDGDL